VKRKIKYIFASKHANKEVIIKMIKKDKVFRKLKFCEIIHENA
jgi:hypothetical protein